MYGIFSYIYHKKSAIHGGKYINLIWELRQGYRVASCGSLVTRILGKYTSFMEPSRLTTGDFSFPFTQLSKIHPSPDPMGENKNPKGWLVHTP